MPLLLEACAGVGQPDLALQRILPLVRAVLRRSAYLMLLMENPPALAELVALCEASPWVAELLAAQPVLRDELLDLGCPPQKARVHHLGVDIEKYEARPRTLATESPLRVLMVGRFTEKKGFPYGLKGFAQFLERGGAGHLGLGVTTMDSYNHASTEFQP